MLITSTYNRETGEWDDNRPKSLAGIVVDKVAAQRQKKRNVSLVDFITYYNFLGYEKYLGFVNWLIDNGELNIKKISMRSSKRTAADYRRLKRCRAAKRFEIWKAMLDIYLGELGE